MSSEKSLSITGLGKKLLKNGLFVRFVQKYADVFSRIPPYILMIEPTNICNLKCPFCGREDMKRKLGNMNFDDFKKIVSELPRSIKIVHLCFFGEPFLNKDILKMAKCLSERKIKVRLYTNLVPLKNWDMKEVLSSGIYKLLVSFDGATKESYEKYRVGADFDEVKQILIDLCRVKKEIKSKTDITMQSLIFSYNEHEIPALIKLAKEIGVDHLILKTASLPDDEKIREKYAPKDKKYSRYSSDFKNIQANYLCHWAWGGVITQDGNLTLCCYDMDANYSYGNVLKEGFSTAYKKGREKRKEVIRKQLDMCRNCSYNLEPMIEVF